MIKELLPHSLTENAKIINITVPVSQNIGCHLLMSLKAAQNAMTFAFGHQFKKDKSKKQIFAVMPGAVATDLNGAKVGDSPFVKSPEETAQMISKFIFDDKIIMLKLLILTEQFMITMNQAYVTKSLKMSLKMV